MPCQSCVDKLAYKLIKNHPKLDLIRAKELAEKAVERVEKRVEKKPKPALAPKFVMVNGVQVDPDYSLPCSEEGWCGCAQICGVDEDCVIIYDYCHAICPSPYPHSHYVSDTCASSPSGCFGPCIKGICAGLNCYCSPSGLCYYACDENYYWNGSECVPVAPPVWGGSALPQLEMAKAILNYVPWRKFFRNLRRKPFCS